MAGAENFEAKNTSEMAQQIDDIATKNNIEFTDADRKKLDEYKDQKDKIIDWNRNERSDFVAKLKDLQNHGQDSQSSAAAIVEHIFQELDRERRENKFLQSMDEQVKDYEGKDYFDHWKTDNLTRKTIKNAYDKYLRLVPTTKRGDFEKQVLQLAKDSYRHVIDENGEIATRGGEGNDKNIKLNPDYILTLAEAKQIAAKIPEIAESLSADIPEKKPDEENAKTRSESTGTKKPQEKSDKTVDIQTPQGKMEVSKAILEKPYELPAGYSAEKELGSVESGLVAYSIDEQTVETLATLGVIATEENLQNSIKQSLANTTKRPNLSGRVASLITLAERYPDNEKVRAKEFLELKGINTSELQKISDYLVFGDVETDIIEAQKYFDAKYTEQKIDNGKDVNDAGTNTQAASKEKEISKLAQNLQESLAKKDYIGVFANGLALIFAQFTKLGDSLWDKVRGSGSAALDFMEGLPILGSFIKERRIDKAKLTKNAEGWTTEKVKTEITKEANSQGVPVKLALAVAKQESGYNAKAVSSVGAVGVMQLMSPTAGDLKVDRYDVAQNIEGGVRYLKQQLDAFGGDTKLALAAYNAGPGAVKKAGNKIPNNSETPNYVAKIMKAYSTTSKSETKA